MKGRAQRNTELRSTVALSLIFIRLIMRETKNPLAHTMNIPNNQLMSRHQRSKQLWIGLVEVRALRRSEALGDAKGAFVNLVTWAADTNEFKANAELVLAKLDLFVVGIESPEPVSI